MDFNPADYLARLVAGDGYIELDADGECRLRNADGSAMELVDGHGRKHSPELPRPFFNIYRKEGLIRQDRTAPAGRGLVFRLTKNGKERAISSGSLSRHSTGCAQSPAAASAGATAASCSAQIPR